MTGSVKFRHNRFYLGGENDVRGYNFTDPVRLDLFATTTVSSSTLSTPGILNLVAGEHSSIFIFGHRM